MNMLMKSEELSPVGDEIHMDHVVGVKGRYRFVVRDKNLKVVRKTKWMNNLILNAGLNKLLGSASAGSWFAYCVVGTGNAPVLPTNTTLSNYNGVQNFVVSYGTERNYTVSPYYLRHTIQYRFNPTGVARNIAEAGIVFSNSASPPNSTTPIDSRVLIVDGGGTPTTIAVGVDEYLDVVWQYTVYPGDQFSGTFSMTIDGVATSFNYVARPSNMVETQAAIAWWKSAGGSVGAGGYATIPAIFPVVLESGPRYTSWASTGDIGSVQQLPTDQAAANAATSTSAAAYVAGSFQRSYEYVWGLDKANVAIKSLNLYFSGGATYQMSLTPTVTKVATKIFKITVRIAIANVP